MAKTVSEIVKEAQRDYDGRIILVKADGLLQEISDKVVEDEKIEFVTTQTSIGNETYRRSVVLLMLDAMKKIPEGEKVEKGQSLGTVGNTAAFEIADDAHLHFEILKDSVQVDPNIYLK